MGKGPRKGSAFEREVCVGLSQWWTRGERDDIFWRAAGSGARSKVRGRAGLSTSSGHGDIDAIDPIGKPLIDTITFEIKRGYNRVSPYDMIDKGPKAKEQIWESFFRQVIESAGHAQSKTWAVIHRRDRREAMIFMPYKSMCRICKWDRSNGLLFLPSIDGIAVHYKGILIIGVPFHVFLKSANRKIIKRMSHGYNCK